MLSAATRIRPSAGVALRRAASSSHGGHGSHDSHTGHSEAGPLEPGLLSSSGRNAIIFSIVAYSAYKFAPEAGPDSQITRFLSSFSTPSETWREINAKHTALTAQSAENVKFIQTTKRPQIHRLQYPQAFESSSPFNRPVGFEVKVDQAEIKKGSEY